MTKQQVMEYMQRYLDGDLSEEECAVLYAHLEQDPDSMRMFERMNHLSNDLASLPKVTPPYSIVDSILPELDQIEHERDTPTPASNQTWFQRISQSVSFKLTAGALVTAGVVSLVILTGDLPKSVPHADESSQILESSQYDHGSSPQADASLRSFTAAAEDRDTEQSEADLFANDTSKERAEDDLVFDQDYNAANDAPSNIDPAEPDNVASDRDRVSDQLTRSDDKDMLNQVEQQDNPSNETMGLAVTSDAQTVDTLLSPAEDGTAILFERTGEYKIAIYDEDGDLDYSSAWEAAESIESYGWSEDGTLFEYELVDGEDHTSVRIYVKLGKETRS